MLMVDSGEHPQIKIADFGLSKCFAPNDPLATMCGSPQVPVTHCASHAGCLCPASVCSLFPGPSFLTLHRILTRAKPCQPGLRLRSQLAALSLSVSNGKLVVSFAEFGSCRFLQYVAPEILSMSDGNMAAYSLAVDMWSIGVILFILLSGYSPFGAPVHSRCVSRLQTPVDRQRACHANGSDAFVSSSACR